jgi:ribosomal protein L11 methylase PrmA
VPDLVQRHPASYRDPESTVLVSGARVLRGLTEVAAARYRAVRDTGLLDDLARDRLLVPTQDMTDAGGIAALAGFPRVLEHEPIAFVSHPYEWPFALLRRAALLHLEIHSRALERGITLADASAYNVQFNGAAPVFIDVGSFRPYVEGELWSAHRQFCEHFLNPLLLAAELGIPHNAWLRGSLEGVSTADLARLMPRRYWLSLRHLFHVLLPARADRHVARYPGESVDRIRRAHLPRAGYRAMLVQLRRWIESLTPARIASTTWSRYSSTRTYDDWELSAKRRLVKEFAASCRPQTLWDFGCNDGDFAAAALTGGARRVIGFDADAGALEQACARSADEALDFLPLFQDLANPSPGLGWRGRERASLLDRARPDALMALAFVHHLALGRNIPLEEVVDFLVRIAPRGLIEFVPKSDATAQRMLALKGDVFRNYSEEAFASALGARARIVRVEKVSATGRQLYWFER